MSSSGPSLTRQVIPSVALPFVPSCGRGHDPPDSLADGRTTRRVSGQSLPLSVTLVFTRSPHTVLLERGVSSRLTTPAPVRETGGFVRLLMLPDTGRSFACRQVESGCQSASQLPFWSYPPVKRMAASPVSHHARLAVLTSPQRSGRFASGRSLTPNWRTSFPGRGVTSTLRQSPPAIAEDRAIGCRDFVAPVMRPLGVALALSGRCSPHPLPRSAPC